MEHVSGENHWLYPFAWLVQCATQWKQAHVHTTQKQGHVHNMKTSTRTQHENKHTYTTRTQAHIHTMKTSTRTHHEHMHTYTTRTHAHVHNMKTSTRIQHEHKHTYTTCKQAHVHNTNTRTRTQHENKHTYTTWKQAHVHNMNRKKVWFRLSDKKIREPNGKITEMWLGASHTSHLCCKRATSEPQARHKRAISEPQASHKVTETSCFPCCYRSDHLILLPSIPHSQRYHPSPTHFPSLVSLPNPRQFIWCI